MPYLSSPQGLDHADVIPGYVSRRADFAKVADALGPEPSRDTLGRYWYDVANALPCLRMRLNHPALTLNQDWGRIGNTFPYFFPCPARRGLPAEHRILSAVGSAASGYRDEFNRPETTWVVPADRSKDDPTRYRLAR